MYYQSVALFCVKNVCLNVKHFIGKPTYYSFGPLKGDYSRKLVPSCFFYTIQKMEFSTQPKLSKAEPKRFDNIIKSPEDDRKYRGLELENGMKVLLTSDPTAERSAASLSVGVGHLSDPDDIPGLAHFLEHMLFLGTEKYPNENDYLTYLSTNGGNANAATYADSTKYYFDVIPEKFEGALDRFAQFFIAPLYTESATEREINAIESEHQKNVQIDSWRIRQVNKSLLSKSHPYSKFGTGNTKTLVDNAKEKGINIRQELLNFQDKWYSANIMGLAVFGKESLDELEKMVIEKFSAVKNKNISAPTWDSIVYKAGEEGWLVNVVPVKDTRSLCLTFPCPDFSDYYRSGPERYISHLIGYEGKGSLLSELKKKRFCNNLMAGYSTSARGFGFFDLIVELTEEGFENINEITKMCFQFIQLLKKTGPQKWIFDECSKLNEMEFRFKEKEGAMTLVTSVSPALHILPMEDMLSAGFLITDWRPDLIEEILSYLDPLKMRSVLVGKKLESSCDQAEFWYGTKYSVRKMETTDLYTWRECELNPSFHLPEPNQFIPQKFDLVHAVAEDITEHPVIIYDTEYIRVWHKQDNEFKKPKTIMDLNFSSPLVYSDPQNCNMTMLFVQLFLDGINEYVYNAELAGLKVKVLNTTYGVGVTVVGFSEKIQMFLDYILKQMFDFEVDSKNFEIFKERYVRSLKNFNAEQPYKLAIYYLSVLLSELAWTKCELLESAKSITPEMLQRFVKQFLSRVHVECFLYGNLSKSDAMSVVEVVEDRLKKTNSVALPLLARQLFPKREYKLNDGCLYLYEKENEFHSSSCIMTYLQFGPQSDQNNILTDLLVQILSEPFSDKLRTKEQLGYITFCNTRKINGSQGIRALVQSSYPVEYVNERIEVFFDKMEEELAEMTEETFQNHKDSLSAVKLEKPKKMASWFNKYWGEIALQEYHFNRFESEVAILKEVSKEEIINYYMTNVSRKNPNRRKLSVHIMSKSGAMNAVNSSVEKSITSNAELITDLSAFKSSKEMYPIMQPFLSIRRKGGRSKL